ncbi:MAG TPA: ABC transporter permease [Roseiflexaceae bacterium]|jgi:simple sugar transport system permease protein
MSRNRFLFILLAILVLIGVTEALGRGQAAPVLIAVSFLATTLQVATPLTLGALSGLYCERAGVVNIAIEGMMLGAAFFGWLASIYASAAGLPMIAALLAGVLAALLAGALLALLHAVLSITFRVDQIISGTVINILAVGLTGFLNRALFFQQAVPHAPGVLPTIHIPLLADIPVVGRIFQQQPITLLAIVLVVFTHWLLFSTRWGLRTRAVGEHPLAADTVGINVYWMRYANVLIGGMIAGLAGAYFTIESVPSFEPGQTAGRGFIALAAMIFGNWTPFGAWSAALLFGAAQALQINAQFFGLKVPSQFVGMLPYILTMIALTGIVGRTIPPAADGRPYEKA